MSRRLLPYGERAVLLACADLQDTQSLYAALRADPWPEIEEVVAGAESLLLRLGAPLSDRRRSELEQLKPPRFDPTETDPITIPVDYSGEDLAGVARLLDRSPDDVIAEHCSQAWTVAFCGFAPGFAYLYGEHERLTVPRRDAPRTRVPAGAVGLADRWSGIYPRAGPGGWQLIGTTDLAMWDLESDPPALLQPGGTVRFVSNSSGTSR
ncbi:MAG TPA: allophanate hydrolase subunit 1 [Microlunatus sp.]